MAALDYAADRGWPVIPLHSSVNGVCSCGRADCVKPAKHPRTRRGFLDAAQHPEAIANWWGRWPDANIGCSPGSVGLIAVDVDGPEGEALARASGAYDVETLECITSRGVHRYYRLPAGVVIGNVARSQLDVRAHHGYVLLPPSIHATGHVYRWHGDLDEIADIPDRLLRAVTEPPGARAHRSAPAAPRALSFDSRTERRVLKYADRIGYGLADGRKTAAFRFAAFLAHDVALQPFAVWRYLATWNSHNTPPLAEGLLAEIRANAAKYGGRREHSA